jgi:hypothetical protein
MEATMFNIDKNRENLVPGARLYCVWIRAHDGENAPLICVWIDPSMTMFESRPEVHEPDALVFHTEPGEASAAESAN